MIQICILIIIIKYYSNIITEFKIHLLVKKINGLPSMPRAVAMVLMTTTARAVDFYLS